MDQMENAISRERTAPLNEVKVIFLGDGGTGKSHIIARLMNDGRELTFADFEGQSTPGIAIKHKEYVLDGRRILVHFWDFGGQEIVHSMHRIFMTERTIYVVVVNARDETQSDRARYWLQNVKSFAPDSPVLLVLNKIDQNPDAVVNERELRTRYASLTQVVRLSALVDSPEQLNRAFTAVLLDEIQESGFLDIQWPASWVKLKHALESTENHYVTSDNYLQLCREAGVHANQKDLLHWFNDLGVSFCIGDDYKLDDYIVLRPDWITNALYILLFNRCEGAQNGLIPLASIHKLLRNAHDNPNIHCTLPQAQYNTADIQYILGIMHKFQLSFQHGLNHEFIPMLSQQYSTVGIQQYTEDPAVLEFRMEFEYLPENLLHRLMVERHQELDIENTWRMGAQFQLYGTGLSALIMINGSILTFLIRHTDPMHRPNTYLTLLKANVDRIVQKMGLMAPRSRLVYKVHGKCAMFDYDRLLRLQARGRKEEYCEELDEDILIEDILNQSAPEGMAEKKLLEDIRRSCRQMQSDIRYHASGEHERNTRLRDDLRYMGYAISDQSKWGVNGPEGGADLIVLDERHNPAAAVQTLNIRSGGSMKAWETHLTKLLYSYQTFGLSTVFSISFVDCRRNDFEHIWARFSERIRTYSPSRSTMEPESCQDISNSDDRFIRIARSAYRIGGNRTTVYHVFVQLEESAKEQYVAEEDRRENEPEMFMHSEVVQRACRVVFLGDSEAGKSLIMARVKDPQMIPNNFHGNTTIGIDIFSRTENIKGQRIRINYWDFGGQEILHSMHRMFLSENTMYVIVLNTRNDNQDAQANFWLRYVQSYALGAPVMLVMNKIDQNKRADLNLPLLQRQFVQEFDAHNVLKISAVEPDPKVFEREFTKQLHEFVNQHINRFQGFSPQEVWIRDKVEAEKETKKVMSRDDFRIICESEKLEEQEFQDELMDRLHAAGIMVHFGEESPMFLDPKWITGAIYRIMDAGDRIASNGVIPLSEIQRLCRENPDNWRGSEDADELVKIMRQYALSFEYESRVPGVKGTKNQEFIPMLCQRREPEEIKGLIEAENTLEMQLIFEYLPSGLLYKLMVDHQKEVDTALTWFTGVKIGREKENYTIIRRSGNILCLYTNFVNKAESVEKLYDFAHQVEKLTREPKYHANLLEKRIKYELNGSVQYFDLDRLKAAESCSVYYTAFSGKEPRKVAVRDILDQKDRSRERATDALLQKIGEACAKLQQRAVFMDRQEDVRNNKLLDQLAETYRIEGQAQIGESPSGNRQNELDLLIRYPDGNPWMIIEALNISRHTSRTYWDKHLNKLVGRYNASWGLRKLVLASYVDCKEDGFTTLYEKYRDHMKTYVPEGCQIETDTFECCDRLSREKNYLQVDQCTYSRGGQFVTVYHYFVRMGDKEPTKEEVAAEEMMI